MAVVILRHLWRRQPNGPVRVDWSNPLTYGLSLLVNNQQVVVSPAGSTITVEGTWSVPSTRRAGLLGVSPDYGGTNTSVYVNASAVGSTPAGATLFCLARTDTSGADRTAVSVGNTTTNTPFFILRQDTSGKWGFQIRDDAGVAPSVVTETGTSPSIWRNFIAVYRSGTGQKALFRDGRLAGSITTSTAGTFSFDRSGVGALVRATNINYFDGVIPIAGIWRRALSAEEAQALSENPWQLLQPIRTRVVISAPSAQVDVSVTLTQVSSASSVATLDAQVTEQETLAGISAAGDVGNLTATATSDAAVTLTEVSASSAVGDLTVDIVGDALSVTLTGVSASAAVDTLSVVSDTADSVSLAGVSASSNVDALDAVSSDVLEETLTGVSAEGLLDDIGAQISGADELIGVSALTDVGILTVDVSEESEVTLTGVSAAAEVFDLQTDLSLQVTVELTGVSATGTVRDLRLPDAQLLLDEDIRAALAPLVQGHVYPLRRPQRTDQKQANAYLPEIVYTIVSDDWQQAETLCGVGLHNTRVQIDVYAGHYREARAFAYAAAEQMDTLGWRINMQPFPDDDEKIYRWQLEYSCWRNEAPPSLPLISTHRG